MKIPRTKCNALYRASMLALFLTLLAGGVASGKGIPKTQPLSYSGIIEDASTGKPASGSHSISISMYKTGTATTAECTTNAGNVQLSGGRFRVALAPQCLVAIQNNADLWIEVSVDGTALPRSKVGAVPYAIETEETDPVYKASAAANITSAQVSKWDKAVTSEADPIFKAHAANKVTAAKMSNWDIAYGWGSHASAGYSKGNHYTNAQAIAAMGSKGTSNPLNHDRYANSECLAAVTTAGYVKGPHTTDAKTLDGFDTNSTSLAVANTIPVTDSSGKLRSALIPALGIWSQNGSNIYYNTGSIGVGTKTPTSKVDVLGTFSAKPYANLGEDTYSSWQGVSLGDKDSCDGNTSQSYTCLASESKTCVDIGGSNQKRNVTCKSTNRGLVVDSTGKVSVGSASTPGSLVVNGTMQATSFTGNGSGLTGVGLVGSIVAWAKNLTGVPSLPSNYVECNGQVLSDPKSPLNGTTIPNLNGTSDADSRFLRGAKTSGGVGGTYEHTHGTSLYGSGGLTSYQSANYHVTKNKHIPPYYEIVWVMQVR